MSNDIYTNKNLPAFNYDWIDTNVVAGRNPLTKGDVQLLMRHGVTHILDLREAHEWSPPKYGLEALEEIEKCGLTRLHLEVKDLGAPSPETFDAAFHFIEDALANQGRVYVHCRAGMERTAAIVTAWFARRNALSYDAAFALLKQRRPIFNPLPHQERAARKWLEK